MSRRSLRRMMSRSLALGLALVYHAAANGADPAGSQRVDFVRDIQPIFVTSCVGCHGPEEQEGRLRLDAKAVVFQGGASGAPVVKGNAAESRLYRRVVGEGDLDQMPLEGKKLTAKQIELIRRWIDQGADWPDGVGSGATGPQKHWAYVKPVRPPLPSVNSAAWADNAVDRFILARLEREGFAPSPPAGKAKLIRRVYLDLVGLPPPVDEVEAFRRDTSPEAYEQLVDRLLASPTYGEHWARQWLDLARYADSNGYQADQFRQVWPYRDWVIQAIAADMPFDQFTIQQLAGDLLPGATLSQRIATGFHRCTTCNVEAGVDPEENRVNQIIDRVNTTGTVWLGTSIRCGQCHEHKYDPFSQEDYYGLFAYYNSTPREVQLTSGVTFDFYGPKLEIPLSLERQARRGQLERRHKDAEQRLAALLTDRRAKQADWEQRCLSDPEKMKSLPAEIRKIVSLPTADRDKAQAKRLADYYLGLEPWVKTQREQVSRLAADLERLRPASTLVMVELDEPRPSHVFERGNFLDKGEPVEPGTPAVLHARQEGLPANRLGLARWLVDRENPLVGRVTVNRWWAEIFGRGIVATVEDFGTQGEPPTHPDLLDWLAVEMVEHGWSRKHIHRLIVTSATYKQSSRVRPDRLQRDPLNKLYGRSPRPRLSAEMVRDNALAISGLLSGKMHGRPIYPPQPSGVWRHIGRNAPKYATSQGGDRFRRGIYVVWRRSAPYASFVNFDAPDRASCVVKRSRTNTPLQALTLMNDPAYIKMARALAERMLTDEAEMTAGERIDYGFRRCLARRPKAEEAGLLEGTFRRELARLTADPKAVAEVLAGWQHPPGVDTARLAAWFFVANILLNLDETITKG